MTTPVTHGEFRQKSMENNSIFIRREPSDAKNGPSLGLTPAEESCFDLGTS